MNPAFSLSTDFTGTVSCGMLKLDDITADCVDCRRFRKDSFILKERLKLLDMRERQIKVLRNTNQILQDRLKLHEEDYLEQCRENNKLKFELKAEREKRLELEADLDLVKVKLNEMTQKHEELLSETRSGLTCPLPPPPPPPPPAPPPPPPPNLFFNFLNRKNGGPRSMKIRSRSCSKIEDCRDLQPNPNYLNNDILDAIKNRKYSLRRIDTPKRASRKTSADSIILEKLFQRRMRIEVSDDSDSNST